ncbi:MAG: hypothetical protein ING29_02330 [Azospirillum sp.]|nr:hypothetical protein [Azospirillum sp.]
MIACRADRFAAFARAAALAVGVAAPGIAWAQAPLRLTPPPAREAPAQPPAPARPEAPSGIEVEQVRPLDMGATGLLEPDRGGLPADAWAGTARRIAERLVRDLPAPVASLPARDMAVRLLASTLASPAGEGEANLTALRARKLGDLGDLAGAEALAERVPAREADGQLARARLDAAWLAGRDEEACALARDALARERHPDFQKALMFCQALAGERQRAEMGLALLRDQGVPEDTNFVALLLAQGGDGRGVRLDNPRTLTPLGIAMLRGAKVPPPADLAQSDRPAVLLALLASAGLAPEIRLAAAERAEAFGAFGAEDLAKLYAELPLTPAQLADPAAFARADGGPRGRAALFQAAQAAQAGARLEALRRLWALGRERGGYATLARASLGALAEIAPSPEHAAFAPDAARAFLLAGRIEDAREWLRFARAARVGGDQAAEDRYAGLWALAAIAGLGWSDADEPRAFLAWREATMRIDARGAPARVALAATLLAGLGHLPAGGAFAAFPETAPARAQAALPHPAVWTALHQAAVAGRTAETIALAAQALGTEGPAGAAPQTLLAVLDALRAVGQDGAARALALEAAIAAGL